MHNRPVQSNRMMMQIACIVLFCTTILLSRATDADALTESELFRNIQKISESRDAGELDTMSRKFFRLYPKSDHIPDIRLMIAENEKNPEEAIRKYRVLVDKYRYYQKRDYAQFRICEILYLVARWSRLRVEAQKGAKLFPKSSYHVNFQLFLAKSLIFLDQLDEASKILKKIARTNHHYENLSLAILLLAHIDKYTSGYSKKYITGITEIIVGFKNSDTTPTALYLLGSYYERKRDYDRSYSAYTDLIKQYPRSPESVYAREHINRIEKYHPQKVAYIPDSAILENIDTIDIRPEIDLENRAPSRADLVYAISLGPFYNLMRTRKIAHLIKKDCKPISIVRLRKNFVIYAGRFSDSETALTMKIRLAEEFGLNGNIVRIKRDDKKQYFYGE